MHRNHLDAEACASLCEAPWAASLRRVDLRHNPLGEAGARALAGAPALAKLERLRLEFADVGRAGAQALAASPHLNFSIRRYWKARYGAAARDPSSSS